MSQLRAPIFILFALAVAAGCKPKNAPPTDATKPDNNTSLLDARKGFTAWFKTG